MLAQSIHENNRDFFQLYENELQRITGRPFLSVALYTHFAPILELNSCIVEKLNLKL